MAYLGSPKATLEVINKYGFAFQKRFGQNFLIDSNILENIVSAANITKEDFVLEIGPGIGTMTQYLCENAREVVAVEIDKSLIPILQDTLSEYNNVEVINEDVLKVDIKKLAEERNDGIFNDEFLFPLFGSGDKYGQSVSNTKFSIGAYSTTSRNFLCILKCYYASDS